MQENQIIMRGSCGGLCPEESGKNYSDIPKVNYHRDKKKTQETDSVKVKTDLAQERYRPRA